jgi:hypothetical protein
MSEQTPRYFFDGFVFGNDGDVELKIKMMKESGFGHNSEFCIELTPKERKQLIKFLKTVDDKDAN